MDEPIKLKPTTKDKDCDCWSIATPERAAKSVVKFYGADAIKLVVSCALRARRDGRYTDYLFWVEALKRLTRLH